MYEKSKRLFERAKEIIPGGVNSPVRAFKAVGGNPLFIAKGAGSRLFDVDGNEYIDYVGSWGPLILGHCHPEVMEALAKVLETGTSYGAPTEREIELAELICEAFPSIEKVPSDQLRNRKHHGRAAVGPWLYGPLDDSEV